MLGYDLLVPIDQLDDWYFNEVLSGVPSMLQDWLVDRRILRKEEENQERVSSLEGLYDYAYMLMPWLIHDVFPAPQPSLLAIGKASVLMHMAFVMLDDTVDGQVPRENRASILITQIFNEMAYKLLAEQFDHSPRFYERFYRYRLEMYEGFGIEHDLVDQQSGSYDYDIMKQALHGKTGHLRILADAMCFACEDNLEAHLSACHDILAHMVFGDQLTDDTCDFVEDYELGRATYPIQRAAQVMGKEKMSDMTLTDLEDAMLDRGIFFQVLGEAHDVYQRGLDIALELAPQSPYLRRMFEGRLDKVMTYRSESIVYRLQSLLAGDAPLLEVVEDSSEADRRIN